MSDHNDANRKDAFAALFGNGRGDAAGASGEEAKTDMPHARTLYRLLALAREADFDAMLTVIRRPLSVLLDRAATAVFVCTLTEHIAPRAREHLEWMADAYLVGDLAPGIDEVLWDVVGVRLRAQLAGGSLENAETLAQRAEREGVVLALEELTRHRRLEWLDTVLGDRLDGVRDELISLPGADQETVDDVLESVGLFGIFNETLPAVYGDRPNWQQFVEGLEHALLRKAAHELDLRQPLELG